MSIQSLVKKAKKGDDDAFYELMLQHKEQLYRIAYSYFKNETDSVEAIQETTYRAYKQLKKLKEVSYFSTWLIRILINYCNDELKRKKRVVVNITAETATTVLEPTSKLDIERFLSKLEPRFQDVIILKYFHDLTIPDIATILERPEGTVKTWLHKALLKMKKMMEREDYHV